MQRYIFLNKRLSYPSNICDGFCKMTLSVAHKVISTVISMIAHQTLVCDNIILQNSSYVFSDPSNL